MAEEKLLTIREVALILGISEKEVVELTEKGSIPAYKVGGIYLRFKREQIESFRKTLRPFNYRKEQPDSRYSLGDRMVDFLYFNDFYILSALIILLIILVILRG